MEKEELDYDEQIHCSSVTVYGMLKSWILQEPLDKEPEQYQGINVFRKVCELFYVTLKVLKHIDSKQ